MKKKMNSSSSPPPSLVSRSPATVAYLQPRSTAVYSIDWPSVCFTCHLSRISTDGERGEERTRKWREAKEQGELKIGCMWETGWEEDCWEWMGLWERRAQDAIKGQREERREKERERWRREWEWESYLVIGLINLIPHSVTISAPKAFTFTNINQRISRARALPGLSISLWLGLKVLRELQWSIFNLNLRISSTNIYNKVPSYLCVSVHSDIQHKPECMSWYVW